MNTQLRTPARIDLSHALRTAAVTALLAMGTTSLSFAQNPPADSSPVLTESKVKVPLGDLDLSTEQGTHVAYERISNAVKQACGFTTRMGDYAVGEREVYLHCYKATMASAIKQVNRPQLAALYAQSSRVPGY